MSVTSSAFFSFQARMSPFSDTIHFISPCFGSLLADTLMPLPAPERLPAFSADAATCCLAGWVRNRRDGSVEALIQGPAEALEKLIAWTRRGPPAARVDDVRIEPAEEDSQGRFELRPTF